MGEITATEIPRIRQPQVSGWEVAAGISDQAEVEEMVISENITPIDQEALQNLMDYVQEEILGKRRPISFNELQKTDEFKQLLAECDLEGLEFTDYKNFLNWQNLQITQQALEEGQQDLEELNKAKEDFYNEYSKKIGKDLNTILTEYENQIQEVLNNYISDFSLNLSMVIDGSKYLNDDDLETYSKIIFEVLNNEGESQYTQDEIKNALTNKDANLEKIYENFINNSNSSSNLLGNAIKRYYPAMSSYIESLNQQYNAQLENSELTIEEIKYILNSYDQNINQIEQQNKANEQLENDLYYAFIMGTEDYKKFKTPGEEGNVSVNIVGEGEFKYYWTPECDLSPIEYINYVLEKENITMEEFLNGKYTEFYIEAGNASNSGDYLHSDMLQLINLIKASEYDENLLKMYNYIYYTQGLDAANEYIYNTESNVNETLAQVNVQAMLESMELNKEYTVMIEGEERNISFIVNDGKLAIKGLGDGVGNFFTGLVSWLNTNEHKTVEEYEQYYFLLSIMSKEDKIANDLIDENGKSKLPYLDITKDYCNIGGEGVYQISQSIGNMIPSMLLSTINPTLGTVSMGISAGGNSFRDTVTNGYDLTDSIIYAVMSGASEAVLERLLGSIPGLGKTDETFAPNISTWLRSCYNEGKEEFIQEGFDILLKSVLFGEEIDLAEAIKQMGVAGVYGAITGGIMNGVAFPFKTANLDANLETIAEANNGKLTNAQIAEMLGTTEKYVSEFMEKRKLQSITSTITSDTITNTQTSTEEIASEISETALETENIPTLAKNKEQLGAERAFDVVISSLKQNSTKKFDSNDSRSFEFKMNRALEEYHNKYGNTEKYEVIKNTPEFIEIVENLYINDVKKEKSSNEKFAEKTAKLTIEDIKGGIKNQIYNENMSFTDVLLNIQENIAIMDLYSESYIKKYVEKNILPSCYVNDSGQIIFRAAKIQAFGISRTLFGSLSTKDGKIGGAFCFPWKVMNSILSNPNIFDQKTGECVNTEALENATGGVNLKKGQKFSIAYIEIPLEKITLPNGANKNAYFGEFQPTGYTSGHLPEILVPACNASNISIEMNNNTFPAKYDSDGNKSNSGEYYKYLIFNSDGDVVDYYFGKIEKDTIINPSSELCDQMMVTVEPRKVKKKIN